MPQRKTEEVSDQRAESLRDVQLATLNILEDFNAEKNQLEITQRATFNILEDFNAEKARLEDTQRAVLNILEDLNDSNEDLRKAQDVLEARVAERTNELARSNAELEQFAYIASHDLQEPLRMVSSYVQLLSNRYQGKLDQDADEFIRFAHDGAARMQMLINDLLAYSRVGTRGMPFREVSLTDILQRTVDNLKLAIKDQAAQVTHGALSVVYGDEGQLAQVFQNLIANAIKFHGQEPPRVHVSAEIRGKECMVSVRDNGIGIAPEYFDKVFLIFQRLHTRKEYPGTGIGLAVCKRIVERHGGRIWVESRAGEGSTFFFTVPVTKPSGSGG